MEKIKQPIYAESSYSQAVRAIQAMTEIDSKDLICIIYLSCYLDKEKIMLSANKYKYSLLILESVNKNLPFWLRWLPIPKANFSIIYQADLKNIYNFFIECNQYPLLELLMVKKDCFDKNFYELINRMNGSIFHNIDDIIKIKQEIFFMGFDFDNMDFEEGVAKATYYTFVPNSMKLYI